MLSRSSIKSIDLLESYHVLHWLTGLVKPKSYLEVGVREGASLCCVLAEESEVIDFAVKCLMDGRTELTTDIVERISECYTNRDSEMQVYIFDDWSYTKDGTSFRIKKLLVSGFKHEHFQIWDGDSKETLPTFFNDKYDPHPDKIDLVFIDGDHTLEGAWSDLNAVAGHFKVLVFHDLHHPQHRYLNAVFKEYVSKNSYPSFTVGKYTRGVGVAFDTS